MTSAAELQLTELSASGTIPTQIATMTRLEELELGALAGHLSGTLPTQLGLLSATEVQIYGDYGRHWDHGWWVSLPGNNGCNPCPPSPPHTWRHLALSGASAGTLDVVARCGLRRLTPGVHTWRGVDLGG